MSLRSRIRTSVELVFKKTGRARIEDVADHIREHFGEEYEAEAKRLADLGFHRQIKRILAEYEDSETVTTPQLSLPGMAYPTAIAVSTGKSIEYVLITHATWQDLQSARDLKAENIANAQAVLDDWDGKMEYLRPIMELNPSLTVIEAARMLEPTAA